MSEDGAGANAEGAEAVDRLLAEVEGLVATCRGELSLTHRGHVSGEHGRELQCVELGPRGGEWIEVGVSPTLIRLRFAGWTEAMVVGGDPEQVEETCELALDFVAVAMFGELRVVEARVRGEVLRRSLEVLIGAGWRRHAKVGSLGLVGVGAWLRRDMERRVRSNVDRVRRPKALRRAGPRGLPAAPWAGASTLVGREAAQIAVDGELDLHNFAPKEVAPLVREYIEVCHQRGIRDLRIVHGKGKGVLRRTVHGVLDEHPMVEDYRLGGHGEGSWGATIVRLAQLEDG